MPASRTASARPKQQDSITDLVCWSKLICFSDDAIIARCEIDAFRYRILHMAARITTSGRRVNLRLDENWVWAKTLATGFARLRAAFA